MIDVVTVGAGGGSIAWISPEGTLKVGPQSAGADPGPLCYGQGRHRADDHRRPRGARPDPAAPARRRDPARRRARPAPASSDARRQARPRPRGAAPTGILEISAWNQANALRQVTVKRGLDVRDFTLATFGGSGSLLPCRLVDILGLAGVLVPPNPGNVSAFGLLTVDVRNDYVQTAVARHDALDLAAVAEVVRRADRPGRRGARRARASPRAEHRFVRTADLRYFGQAYEVRVAVPDGAGRRRRRSTRSPPRSTPSTARSTATTSATTRASRSSGSTCGSPASARSGGPRSARRPPLGDGARAARETGRRAGLLRRRPTGTSTPRSTGAPTSRPATVVTGPAIIEEFGSTVPLHPGFTARVDDVRQPRRDRGARRDRDEPARTDRSSRSAT